MRHCGWHWREGPQFLEESCWCSGKKLTEGSWVRGQGVQRMQRNSGSSMEDKRTVEQCERVCSEIDSMGSGLRKKEWRGLGREMIEHVAPTSEWV